MQNCLFTAFNLLAWKLITVHPDVGWICFEQRFRKMSPKCQNELSLLIFLFLSLVSEFCCSFRCLKYRMCSTRASETFRFWLNKIPLIFFKRFVMSSKRWLIKWSNGPQRLSWIMVTNLILSSFKASLFLNSSNFMSNSTC